MNALRNGMVRLSEYGAKNHSGLLKWTTLIIWACSLVAEVGTFAFNKKLPDKEKSFIIKQELTAGGISLAIMYLLSDSFEKGGKWLVKNAKLLPGDLPVKWRTEEAVQKILNGDTSFVMGNVKWIKKLVGFQEGMRVLSGTLGAIIAFNITTPLISNKIASYFQNKALADKTVSLANGSQTFSRLSAAPSFRISQVSPAPFSRRNAVYPVYGTAPLRQTTGVYGNLK